MTDPTVPFALLPTFGRPERHHFYAWKAQEEHYAEEKFAEEYDQRTTDHDASWGPLGNDFGTWWHRQIGNYLMRAARYMDGITEDTRPEDAQELRQLAAQAVAKAAMTAQGCAESMIRTFGPMPKPGLSSGSIEPWAGAPPLG